MKMQPGEPEAVELGWLRDRKLVREAMEDREVMVSLLRRVYPVVAKVVYMIAGNTSVSEDLCQSALLQIHRSLPGFRGECSIETWTSRIAYRTSMRELKGYRKHGGQEIDAVGRLESSALSPERTTARTQALRLLSTQLATLSEKSRHAVYLHYVDGFTVKEIARITGATGNTVKARIKSGLKSLRKCIARKPELKKALLEARDD